MLELYEVIGGRRNHWVGCVWVGGGGVGVGGGWGVFFFNDTATTEIYTLSLHDALPIYKVTIIPRGPALGLTQQLPKADRLSMSKRYAKAKISVLMGEIGRAHV